MAAFQRATMQVDDVASPRRRVVRPARKVASSMGLSIGLGLEHNFETKVSMTPPARLPGTQNDSPFAKVHHVDLPATDAKRHALPRSQAFGPFSPLNGSAYSSNTSFDLYKTARKHEEDGAGLQRTVPLQRHTRSLSSSSSTDDEQTHGNEETNDVQLSKTGTSLLSERHSQHQRSRTSESMSSHLDPTTTAHPRRRRMATTPARGHPRSNTKILRDDRMAESSSPISTNERVGAMGANDDSSAESEIDEVNTLRPGNSFSCRRMSGARSISTSHSRQHTAPSLSTTSNGEAMARSATTSSICDCGCGSPSHFSLVNSSSSSRFDETHSSKSSNNHDDLQFRTPNKRRARVQGSSVSLRGRNFSTASPVAAPADSEEGSLFGSASASSIRRASDDALDDAPLGGPNSAKRRSVGSLSLWHEGSQSTQAFPSAKKSFSAFSSISRPAVNNFARLSSESEQDNDSPSRFAFDDSGVALQSPSGYATPLEKRADKAFVTSIPRASLKFSSDEAQSSPSKMAAARRFASEQLHGHSGIAKVSNGPRGRSSLANETRFSDDGSSANSTPDARRSFSTAASVPERLATSRENRNTNRSSQSSSSLVVEGDTAPYLTPQTYKNVMPLQAAFMSTGLASKRSRPTMSNLDPLSGERLPPLPAMLNYSNKSNNTHAYQSSGNMAASLGLRDVVAAANAHAAASANVSTPSAMPDTPIKRTVNSFAGTTSKGFPIHSRLSVAVSPSSNDGNDSSSGGSMCGGDSPLLNQDCDSPTLGMTSMMSARSRSPMSMLEAVSKDNGQRTARALPDPQSSLPFESRPAKSSDSPAKSLERKRSFVRQSLPNPVKITEDSLRAHVMTRPLSLSRPHLGLQRKSSSGPTSEQMNALAPHSPLYDVIPSTPTRHSSTIKWYEAAQLVSTPSPSHRTMGSEHAKRESWQTIGSMRGKSIRNNSTGSTSALIPSAPARPYRGERPGYFETRFALLGTLGKGEFSQVDKAEDKVDGLLYAVKRMKKAYQGPRDRIRRLEEVDVLRTLSKDGGHANIVTFIDAWEESRHLFIQTELCPCVDFSSFLTHFSNMGGSLDEARLWKVLCELTDGLGYIHDMQVLHLDLKPANIFITDIATLKIGDFGMATRWPPVDGRTILAGSGLGDGEVETNKDNASLTASRSSKNLEREGDREYIAPEIIQRGQYGKPADIFSVGLIMLEAAGNVILPDNGEPWQKLRNDDFSDVVLSHFSLSMVRLITQCLSSDPASRPTIEDLTAHPVLRAVSKRVAMGVEMSELDQLPIFDLPASQSSKSVTRSMVARSSSDEHTDDSQQGSTDTEMTIDGDDAIPCTPRHFGAQPPVATGVVEADVVEGVAMERTSSNRSALGLEGVDDDVKVLNVRGALIYENFDFLVSVLEADPDPSARLTASVMTDGDSAKTLHNDVTKQPVPTISVSMNKMEDFDAADEGHVFGMRGVHVPTRASPLRQSAHDSSDRMDMDQ